MICSDRPAVTHQGVANCGHGHICSEHGGEVGRVAVLSSVRVCSGGVGRGPGQPRELITHPEAGLSESGAVGPLWTSQARFEPTSASRFVLHGSRRPPRTGEPGSGPPAGRAGRPGRRTAWPRPSGPGRSARVTAEASSTASQPSSIASAASEAVPIPASRITGTVAPLDDQLDVVRVADAEPGADRRAERHHRRAAGVLQLAGQDRVVVGVRQHDEAVGDQAFGRVEQLDRVGQQGALVGDHLQLDPVGLQRLPGQLGGEHRLAGGVAAGGVGQDARCRAGPARRAPSPGAPGRAGASRRWSARCRRRAAPAPAPPGWARRRCP